MRVVLIQCKDEPMADKMVKDTEFKLCFYIDADKEEKNKKEKKDVNTLSAQLVQRTSNRQVIWVTEILLPKNSQECQNPTMKHTMSSSIWINDFVRKEQIPHVFFD